MLSIFPVSQLSFLGVCYEILLRVLGAGLYTAVQRRDGQMNGEVALSGVWGLGVGICFQGGCSAYCLHRVTTGRFRFIHSEADVAKCVAPEGVACCRVENEPGRSGGDHASTESGRQRDARRIDPPCPAGRPAVD